MLWLSDRKATVPVGVAELEELATVTLRVKFWLGAGFAEVVVRVTTGVGLVATAITVPPLAELPLQLLSPA